MAIGEHPGLIERGVRAVSSPLITGIAAFNRWRLPPMYAPHPLLTGLNAPLTEELTLENLAVEGAIPDELDGRYVRIGPNAAAPDPRTYHFFTGDGMLHGVRIAGGAARWYRNRWIRSTDVAKARGVPAAPGPRHIFDTVNTSVVAIAGAGHALVEAGSTPVRFGELLDEQRYDDLGGTLPGSFTAHPRRDPATGELHAICYEATDANRVRYNVIGVDGRVRRSVVIAVRDGPLIHDCAITARYVLVLDLPVTLSLRVVLAGHGFPYRWNPRHPARLGLLPRDGEAADIRWIELPRCFTFHAANAFDLPDGRVAFDCVAYGSILNRDDFLDEPPRGLERWTVDPRAGTVATRTIDPSAQEFPVINETRRGLPYRYAYALALAEGAGETLAGAAPLLKHDLERGERLLHDFGEGRIAGEFVFVPRRAAGSEDDGWLIGMVIERDQASTALEILDAREFAAPPVATIRIPHRIPPGIHGAWLPDS